MLSVTISAIPQGRRGTWLPSLSSFTFPYNHSFNYTQIFAALWIFHALEHLCEFSPPGVSLSPLLVLYFLDQFSLCDTSQTTLRATAEKIAHCFLRTVPGTCASYSICQIAVYHLVASLLSTPQRDPEREAVTYSSLHSWYLVQPEWVILFLVIIITWMKE